MNRQQLELIEMSDKMKSSSLYILAKKLKDQCLQQKVTYDTIKRKIFTEVCNTAAWYGAKGPENFPIPLDAFIYLSGKILDKNSEAYLKFEDLYTYYDHIDFSELIGCIIKALLDWTNDPNNGNDVAAITMYIALMILTHENASEISEKDQDLLLMNLMRGTDIDNNKANPEGVRWSALLWAFSAIYIDFENRFARIIADLVAEAGK